MNLNKLIQTVRTGKPPRIVLHGVHGVGKSTWASNAPDPIFIITEDGLTSIDVPHFPLITDLDQVWEYMGLLIDEDNPYKTFVLDTADWLEKIIWAHICKEANVDNIESFGFGKGYTIAMKQWDRLYRGLELLRDKGMATVILAHNEIKAYNPPPMPIRLIVTKSNYISTRQPSWRNGPTWCCLQISRCMLIRRKERKRGRRPVVRRKGLSTPQTARHGRRRPGMRYRTL